MGSQENVNKLGLSQANHNEELTCKWKTKQKNKNNKKQCCERWNDFLGYTTG